MMSKTQINNKLGKFDSKTKFAFMIVLTFNLLNKEVLFPVSRKEINPAYCEDQNQPSF